MIKKIIFVLLTGGILWAASPYDEGMKAYKAKNYETALRYFYISARHYDVRAYTMLGIVHDEGKGTGVSKEIALYWYSKAANKNRAYAQYRLAKLYEDGIGIKKDMKKASLWYRRAAANGSKEAKVRLSPPKADSSKKSSKSEDSNSSVGFFDSIKFW